MASAHQIDLFAPPLLLGLRYEPGFLSDAEEAELITRIDATPLAPFRFQKWTGKRLTRSYGWNYDFERGSFGPADPLPDWLLPLRNRAARFAALPPDALVQALLIRYDPGAGIGWHKDRPVFEHVVGISLGGAAPMRFRRRTADGFERRTVSLEPRSIYHLAGEARHAWEHSITEQEEPRWSITFRSLKPA
ncbi:MULTISPECIES: alpha-ketoglutarate-dependent dioxygenase AlkB [Sphingobium]|uniref:Fe2OG dioxygenase domain-containing protein n=1 Tax=Sphingobium fuliginis (strain ATCC 27551) TaxID=336203 RepID=A0A292ZNX3_SPHSA|nr:MULTISPECIES: alpha-ketoglutarate-dependent dioxygenase AlkB [Sphingobium]OAP29974.1 2OG-Fe(II) oxygenase [Sphingobium sp. 20006FA]KXU29836.1 2OG-Fe(II) oxygenase [Sphingobium sp. AM]KYC30383.1 2OG-Fe(II) oxygenase [Sphingobium sp. 22B]MCB4859047.1 alpha-ketoglutarate-dependent dioxygenase AlkB [Sphingobium sp. PNB]MEC6701358.1 alpha-ketoglutarate-dependent dioxygenase AlkB [Sphingobium sp. SJ10-10]